jgi:hypothetical protein
MKTRAQQKVLLRVMHAEDMVRVHPLTDWSFVCDACQQGVGIYPSGQSIINETGRADVRIVCNRCLPPPQGPMVIRSEVLREITESIPNRRKQSAKA